MTDLSFSERTVTPTGREGRRGHHYSWARCVVCGDLQLVRRAGLIKRKCVMTPKCRGGLEPSAPLASDDPVGLARGAFDATVVAVLDETEGAA